MPALDLNALTVSLQHAGAPWTPRQSPQSTLSDADKRALLGVIFPQSVLDRVLDAAPADLS